MSSEKTDAREDRHAFARLTLRLNGWYAAVVLIGLSGLSVLAWAFVRRAAIEDQRIAVETRLQRHQVLLEQVGLPAYERAVSSAAALEGDAGAIRVRDHAGRTLFQHGPAGGALIASTTTGDLRVEIEPARSAAARELRHLAPALAVMVIGFLLVAVGGGVWLTRAALRPVAALTETNRRLMRMMREALDNVAHDLRTPMSRLRGVAEVALSSADPAALRDALGECIEESDRVLTMLRTLMDISEADAGLMRLDLQLVDLARLARETVELYAEVAEEAGVRLGLDDTGEVLAVADGTRLRQAFANLVDNAIKYTAAGGTVRVSVAATPATATFRVRDTGRGIPAESLPRIWDRLYRVDTSRSERGLGLGLSLVRAIVHAHGGTVAVDSTPGRGSEFALSIPRVPASASPSK